MRNIDPTLLATPSHPELWQLPDAGHGYNVISRSEQGLRLQLQHVEPPGLDFTGVVQMQAVLPLTSELYAADAKRHRLTIPAEGALHTFSREYLQPLGATTLRIVQRNGEGSFGQFRAEQVADCVAEGTFPVAIDACHFFHDMSDHVFGAMTLAETPTRIFQQAARLYQELQVPEPGLASVLAISLASVADRQTSVRARYLRGAPSYREEPMLLTGLAANLKYYNNPRLLNAVENTIDDVPDGEQDVIVGDTKLDRWVAWESLHMPAYGARIKQKLSETPRQKRGIRIATALRSLVSLR